MTPLRNQIVPADTAAMGVRRTLATTAVLLATAVGIPTSAGPSVAESSEVSAYFFGDSLMSGTGSSPRRPVMARVAAARLGWQVEVDAWGGTGYTTTGSSPSYLDRLRRPGAMSGRYDVVLLEGGTNDARSAADPRAVRQAVEAVVDEVERRQPQAQIVLMGAYDPPPPGTVDPRREVVDRIVAGVAAERGLAFFSPLSQGWADGRGPGFLTDDRLHPTTRGYGLMGALLADELTEARAGRSSQAPQSASNAP